MPQLLYHHLASHHLHYSEINQVYLSRAARAFGLSMIGIFVPIYLYTLGYSLVMIALFFIVANLIRMFATPLAGFLLSRLGAKRLMALCELWSIVFVILLLMVEPHPSLLLVTAFVWGVDLGLFWPAHHYNLSYAQTKGKSSRQVGFVFMLLSIAQALGPLAGGVVATQFGIQYTFLAAIALLLVAGYIFLHTPEHTPLPRFAWKEVLTGWNIMRPHVTANGMNGFQAEAALNLWPLFIFLFLGTYQTVGIAVSTSLVITLIVIYLIGLRSDKGYNWQQIYMGSKGSSVVHVARSFVQTFGGATVLNLIHEIMSYLYRIPFVSYYYHHASRAPSRLAYILKLEIAVSFGSMASWGILLGLGLFLSFQAAVIGAFTLAAIGTLFLTKIARPLVVDKA